MQNKIISITKPIMEEAIRGLVTQNVKVESIGIADLGCSSGPNCLAVVTEIMGLIYANCRNLGRESPEFRVSLNDLPCNDFNSIFEDLPNYLKRIQQELGVGLGSCFVSAVAGSFYGRVFPAKSLQFVHSSSSLHWLSQVKMSVIFNIKFIFKFMNLLIIKIKNIIECDITFPVVVVSTPTFALLFVDRIDSNFRKPIEVN